MKPVVDDMRRRLPYHERIRGYERDKENLLRKMSQAPAKDFQEQIIALQKKWGI